MSRILGLDIGHKRIGVAISDETETLARSFETISVKSIKDSIDHIAGLVDKNNVAEVVIGLPLNMDGSEGPSAKITRDFAYKLKKIIDIEVIAFDERLTTKQGENILIQADMSRKKRKEHIDKLAAQIMLQAYLDSKQRKGM